MARGDHIGRRVDLTMHRFHHMRILRATSFAATLILAACATDEPATSRLTVVERSDAPRRIDVLFVGPTPT